MTMTDIKYEIDGDGIATVTFDQPEKSANTMAQSWVTSMEALIEKLETEENLKGSVLASAKKTFFAGGDLEFILNSSDEPEQMMEFVERLKAPLRALEKMPVPIAAAINGAALGGGWEICLIANHRIILNEGHAKVGLPEVTLGLLPGAGGVVRMTALLGLEKALPLLAEGKQLRPDAALKAGLVHELRDSAEELIPAAKEWIIANPKETAQAWDKKGFSYPGGNADSPQVRQVMVMGPTMLFTKTRGLMPAPEKIVDVAVNSMRMDFDAALRNESRGLVALIQTPQCKAAITTFFFGLQAVKSGKIRPEGEQWKANSCAVLGAGMMGAGIAWAQSNKGLPTVLKDMSMEQAEKGKSYSQTLADKRVKRGFMSEEKRAEILERITPSTDDADFEGTGLIIEAVFEDIALKEKVIAETFPRLSPDGIYASNTSTLPISILAEACPDPSRFIGLHFFSPVDKMKIVEIITGEKTSAETLRKAYDYVAQIGYTPIVVNDSRGFFTSRVFGTYVDEGQALLRDGVSPVAVERAGWLSGMPVGPLAVTDEVSLTFVKKVADTHVALDAKLGVENGFPAEGSSSEAVAHKMVEMGRGGRQYGGGFYDYSEDGSKTLWEGLAQFKERDLQVSIDEAVERLLYRQAIETLRCLDEGVVKTKTEADIGSIFAIGFPPHTGGALQYVAGIGVEAFKARADQLADTYGERFRIPENALVRLAEETRKAA